MKISPATAIDDPRLEEFARLEGLPEMLARAARLWPGRPALRFDPGGQQFSFAGLADAVRALATALAGHGVAPGDRVAVMLPNRPEFPLAWLALASLGATMVPLSPRYRQDDAAFILDHARVSHVVAEDSLVPLLAAIRNAAGATGAGWPILSVDGAGVPPALALAVAGAGDAAPVAPAAGPAAPVNIQYTSGTTGRPKGCVLSNPYWVAFAANVAAFAALGPGDVMLTAQPFHYIDPQWNVATALLSGAELVILDRFHPSTFWERVRAHRVTWFYCLGVMPNLLLRQPPAAADRDHSVRLVMCSAIPPDRHAAIEARWGVPWREVFGMTESGADLMVDRTGHDECVGSGLVGRPTLWREACVLDAADRPLPPGETGELALRGDFFMDGYWRDPEATEAGFRAGWWHTGDLAVMDPAGRFRLVGRIKEMIRRAGENISAAELEATLAAHPEVRFAACLAVPDEIRGEEVRAWVVPGEGARPDPAALAAWCAERLAAFKVPRYWSFREDLPRTPSERIARGRILAEGADPLAGCWDRVEARWR